MSSSGIIFTLLISLLRYYHHPDARCRKISWCRFFTPRGVGGGHLHWQVVWDVLPSRPPFQDRFFKPFSSSRDPTSVLEKFHIFKPSFHRFWLKFSSWDTNFSKHLFWRPQFQAKKSVLETLPLKMKTWSAHTYPHFFEYWGTPPSFISEYFCVPEKVDSDQALGHGNQEQFFGKSSSWFTGLYGGGGGQIYCKVLWNDGDFLCSECLQKSLS